MMPKSLFGQFLLLAAGTLVVFLIGLAPAGAGRNAAIYAVAATQASLLILKVSGLGSELRFLRVLVAGGVVSILIMFHALIPDIVSGLGE